MPTDLISLGLHSAAKTATPDEFGKMLYEAFPKTQGDSDEAEKKEKDDKDKAAKDKAVKAVKDAEEMEAKEKEEKAVKDAMDEMDESGANDAEHPEGCKCEKCMGGKDEDESVVLPVDERPESEFSVKDAAKFLNAMKSAIAKSKDKGAVDAWKGLNKGLKAVSTGVKDGLPDPFVALTRISVDSGVADADYDEDVPAFKFFSGVDHATGLKNYNEYLAARSNRR